ncbi:hypothetical protein GCM10020256_09510 [Streptomyces thermocoprophilus]
MSAPDTRTIGSAPSIWAGGGGGGWLSRNPENIRSWRDPMAQVEATTERVVAADPEKVFDTLADYTGTRAKLLPEHFSEYEVREGGDGEGTLVHWKLQATSKRVRDCLLDVTEPTDGQLVEKDRNSSMVTTWTVTPARRGPLPGRRHHHLERRRRHRRLLREDLRPPRGSAVSTTPSWPGWPARSRSNAAPAICPPRMRARTAVPWGRPAGRPRTCPSPLVSTGVDRLTGSSGSRGSKPFHRNSPHLTVVAALRGNCERV